MSDYKSADIQRLFDVSSETVRRWSQEFEEYLSPNASPGKGRARQFTLEDLKVFALVAEIKNDGGTYDDAHLALKSGQKGDVDELLQERSLDIHTSVELDLMQQRFQLLQIAHDEAVERAGQLENELIRLKTELKQMDEVKEELKSSQDIINKLNREIGRLEAHLEIAKSEKDD